MDRAVLGKVPYGGESELSIEAHYVDGRFCAVGVYVRQKDDPKGRRGNIVLNVEGWRGVIAILGPALGIAGVHPKEIAPNPTHVRELLQAVGRAQIAGRPFHKTGRNGLYARRAELPDAIKRIGRDRLELLAGELLKQEKVVRAEDGALYVPDHS